MRACGKVGDTEGAVAPGVTRPVSSDSRML